MRLTAISRRTSNCPLRCSTTLQRKPTSKCRAGPKAKLRSADVIGNAVKVMRIATGEEAEDLSADDGKDKIAQSLGRRGSRCCDGDGARGDPDRVPGMARALSAPWPGFTWCRRSSSMRLSRRQAYDSSMRQCRGPASARSTRTPLLAHRAIVGDDHCYVLLHSGSLAHVESREHAQVVAHLFAMAIALSVGALLLAFSLIGFGAAASHRKLCLRLCQEAPSSSHNLRSSRAPLSPLES
jgi:hypothetical protein